MFCVAAALVSCKQDTSRFAIGQPSGAESQVSSGLSQECIDLYDNADKLAAEGKLLGLASGDMVDLSNPALVCPRSSRGPDIDKVCVAASTSPRDPIPVSPNESWNGVDIGELLFHLILNEENYSHCRDIFDDNYFGSVMDTVPPIDAERLNNYKRRSESFVLRFLPHPDGLGDLKDVDSVAEALLATSRRNEWMNDPNRHPRFRSLLSDAFNYGLNQSGSGGLSVEDNWEIFLLSWEGVNFSDEEWQEARAAFDQGWYERTKLENEEGWTQVEFDSVQESLLAVFDNIESWNWCSGDVVENGVRRLAYYQPRSKRIVLNGGVCTSKSLYEMPTHYVTSSHRAFLIAAHELGHAIDDLATQQGRGWRASQEEARATLYGTYFAQCAARLWYRSQVNYFHLIETTAKSVEKLKAEGRYEDFERGLQDQWYATAKQQRSYYSDMSHERRFAQCNVNYWRGMESYFEDARARIDVDAGTVPRHFQDLQSEFEPPVTDDLTDMTK